MSATSYYSSKARAGARTERIRTEIDRSSAYILDSSSLSSSNYSSSKPSYTSTLGRQGSFREEGSRTGRSSIRDSSLDFSSRPRRSSSMEYSAPVKLRTRDHSVDYNTYSKPTYTANNRAPRPITTNFDDDEHSAEYKKIMGKTDVSLALSKYSKKDEEAVKVDGMIEDERRSKAYDKIKNQSSTTQMEKDAYRSTMCDIFADCKSFSAKTMNAINKEVLYKEEKGPKKYGWRKDMDSYEDNLEKMSEHRRNVRESTRATRDVATAPNNQYRDINAKLRDYDRECRREVDNDLPSKISVQSSPTYKTQPTTSTYTNGTSYTSNETSSYTNGTSAYTNGTSSATNGTSYNNGTPSYSNRTSSYNNDHDDSTSSKPKRGSWRKDIEVFEEKISTTKKPPVINRNTETNVETNTYRNTTKVNTPAKTEEVKSVTIKIEDPKPMEPPKWKKPEPAVEAPKPVETPKWKKPETPKIEESKPVESKTISSYKTTTKIEETKPVENKPPAWKKPEVNKVEDTPAVVKTSSTEKKVEETKIETKPKESPKPAPKWKKTTISKIEEAKPVETPKPTPKWKKPETPKKIEEEKKPEETKKAETPKPAPKWKKPESAKPVEVKPAEPEKPVPKWKKSVPAKKEEPKPAEAPKPTPKWKKPETAKKEEPKPAAPEKPVPKWKKAEPAKKEEPKPVEPEKPVPKWKKPASAKKEEQPIPEPPAPEPPAPEPVVEESKPEPIKETEVKPVESEVESKNEECKEGEKKEEEEETDHHGMKAMAKEQQSKFSAMDEEFAAGATKLSSLRAKMKALRLKHKAAAEADAAAEAARQG